MYRPGRPRLLRRKPGHIAKIAGSLETDEEDPTRAVAGGTPSHRSDAGIAWGALIHGLLEHAMRHEDAGREDLIRLAKWLTFEEPQLRRVIDEAVDTVEAFTRSEFWQLASRSDHAVEVPFQFAEGDKSLLAGVIDLVFKSGDDWQIVEYKTDIDSDEARTSPQYKHQVAAYQKALASCGLDNIRVSSSPFERLRRRKAPTRAPGRFRMAELLGGRKLTRAKGQFVALANVQTRRASMTGWRNTAR